MFDLRDLAVRLYDVGAVRIGSIEAKVGLWTPIYFDLRILVSYPQLMVAVAQQLQTMASSLEHDLICGVPYAALPLATVMSINTNKPMIMKRKEAKIYGTKKIIEGVYSPGQKCIVIEDVVTSGKSLLETVKVLRSEGLEVSNGLLVLEGEQGGASILKENGVSVITLFTLSNLVKFLQEAGKISEETVSTILEHVKGCQYGCKDNLEN